MKTFRDLALSLAAIALVVIAAVNVDLQHLGIGSSSATPTPTAAPQAVRAAAEATPTPVLRVQPEAITMRGYRTGVSAWLGRIGPWDFTPAMSVAPVPLTVWQVDKDKTIQPADYQLVWSSLSGLGWHANLVIEQQGEDACRRLAAPAAAEPRCFTVSVEEGEPAPTGVYSTTLYVSNQKGAETAVPVRLKVGRSVWWPVAMVILGILTTEFLVHWGKQRYYQLWHTRRGDWIDLIADSSAWATILSHKAAAVYPVLRVVRTALRAETTKLADWLAGAAQGTIALGDLPSSREQAADWLQPLRLACGTYLRHGPPQQISELEDAVVILCDQAVAEAVQYWQAAQAEATALYSAASALKPAWQGIAAPAEPALRTIWAKLDDLWNELNELGLAHSGIRLAAATALAVAEATSLLKTNLDTMQSNVVANARELSASLAALPNTPAKAQIANHLTALANLGSQLERAQAALAKVGQPIKYCQPTQALDQTYQRCTGLVRALDKSFDSLTPTDLAAAIVEDTMLRPVKDNLNEAERLAADKDISEAWSIIGKKYEESQRFVRTGRYLQDLYLRNQESVQSPEVDQRLQTAYRLLLEGKTLAAQIEIERAERIYLAGNPLAKRVVGLVMSALQPVLEALSALVWMLAEPLAGLLRKIRWVQVLGPGGPTAPRPPQPSVYGAGTPTARQATPSVVPAVLAIAAVIILFWLIYWAPQAGVTLLGKEPSWFVAATGAVLLTVGVLFLLVVVLRYAVLWLRLVREHTWPNVQLALLTTASLALTIIVAAAVIIVANNLANTLETWGTTFDFVAAFTWGAVAGQSTKPLQSALQKALAAAKAEASA